jgi:hypothetical protein
LGPRLPIRPPVLPCPGIVKLLPQRKAIN